MVDTLTKQGATESIWKAAIKEAKRSTLGSFRTGALIIDYRAKIISKGCSHYGINPEQSIHAEEHALMNNPNVEDCTIIILTLGKASNLTYSSRPCFRCVNMMLKARISEIIYPERDNSGVVTLAVESPEELLDRAIKSKCRLSTYAKEMRII